MQERMDEQVEDVPFERFHGTVPVAQFKNGKLTRAGLVNRSLNAVLPLREMR